jgi:hypothetical protein
MKSKIILFALVLCSNFIVAQTNQEISYVYINRAEASYYEGKLDEAITLFDKAMKYITEISESRVAKVGMLLHYELKDFQKAKIFSTQYFALEINKNTDDYLQMLEVYVNIQEELEKQKAEDLRLQQEKIKQKLEKRRRDSLSIIWNKKSEALTIKVDVIKPFNQYGVAIYQKDNKVGLLSENGVILVGHNKNAASLGKDDYIILLNKIYKPTKVYCFNSKTNNGFFLPNVTKFNLPSTNFGVVVASKTKGKLIAYPNNSLDVMIYDIGNKSFINDPISSERLKELKKQNFIDKYSKDGKVKIDGERYYIGTHFGGGIYPLFNENKTIYGYFLAANGKILPHQDYNYLGFFSNGRAQVVNINEQFWIDQNGIRYEESNDEVFTYNGNSEIAKLGEGKYQIHKNIDDKSVIVFGDKKLPSLKEYLNKGSLLKNNALKK